MVERRRSTICITALAVCAFGTALDTSAVSSLIITDFARNAPGQFVPGWTAETDIFANDFFVAQRTTNLTSNFNALSSPIPENASLLCTDAPSSAGGAAFYRLVEPAAFTAFDRPGAFTAYAATDTGTNGRLPTAAKPH